MVEFLPLTATNFHCYQASIMATEELFPEEIREQPEDYLAALGQQGAQAFVALCGGKYAGNVVGFPPCEVQRQVLRFDEVDTCLNGLIYLFNIASLPDFQGQGLGRMMLGHFAESAYRAGFCKIGGHFRPNGSLENITRLGAEVLTTFDNWFETGESYAYCELNLPLGKTRS